MTTGRLLRVARRFGRALVVAAALLILSLLVVLIVDGLRVSPAWYGQTNFAGGFVHGRSTILQPPFPLFSTMDVFNSDVHSVGTHYYLLGSDGAGRDLLALVAHGAIPSAELVLAVVAARLVVGLLAGFLMALGFAPVRVLSDGMGRWISGFPYLMLATILIGAFTPGSRFWAFVIGMAAIGWRDIARTVADIIEHVRAQPFALGAKALGTTGVTFFRLHVLPFLRPALAVEIPFQASAVLVLLAELGYLQVFLGGSMTVALGGGNSPTPTFTIAIQPELGQLLSNARQYILLRQFLPVLVPAVAVAVAAFAFELIGVALRSRRDEHLMAPGANQSHPRSRARC